MSRPVPTKEEQTAGDALVAFLRSDGHLVEGLEFDDKPDLRFTIDGQVSGCECVHILPEGPYRLTQTRFKQITGGPGGAKAVQVVWPKEAHVWTREAIRSKERKLPEYRKNAGTAQIDLLVHAPIGTMSDAVRAGSASVMNQIRWAATRQVTEFRTIFFWSAETGVERIWPPTHPSQPPTFDFARGYPTDGFTLVSNMPFTTTSEGEAPVEYDFGIVDPIPIIVRPMSDEFRLHRAHFNLRRMRLKVIAYATKADLIVEYV